MVRRALFLINEFGERTVRVKWVIPAYLLIFAVAYGLFESARRYSEDQAALSQRADAAAAYEASLNEYEACLRRVESRTEIRGMFVVTFDAIEETSGPSTSIYAARIRLNERYPELVLADCQQPEPPTSPPTTEN